MKMLPVGVKGMKYNVRQVLCARIEMARYWQKNELIYHMFHQVFEDCKISIGYVNGDSSIQKILYTLPSKSPTTEVMSRPSCFQMQQYFYSTMFLRDSMLNRLLWTK